MADNEPTSDLPPPPAETAPTGTPPTETAPAAAPTTETAPAGTPPTGTAVIKPKNGLGVAALVIGVSALVAMASVVLFGLALVAGIVGVVFGIIGLVRASEGRATNRGQAVTGLICSGVALILAISMSVRVGIWVADNKKALDRLGNCFDVAEHKSDVATCISQFINEARG